MPFATSLHCLLKLVSWGKRRPGQGHCPPTPPTTAARGDRASKKEHLDWNLSVVTLTPALLLKAFPSRNIQSPKPFKEGRACNAPCLADSPGQPKGSGRLEASLHDRTAPRVSAQQGPASSTLGNSWTGLPGLTSSLKSLVLPLWLGQGRQVSLGYPLPFPFSQSWSPRTQAKFRGHGPEWKAPDAKQEAKVQH